MFTEFENAEGLQTTQLKGHQLHRCVIGYHYTVVPWCSITLKLIEFDTQWILTRTFRHSTHCSFGTQCTI